MGSLLLKALSPITTGFTPITHRAWIHKPTHNIEGEQSPSENNMAKFEGNMVHHAVYELHRPMGHGMRDQKHEKGNLSPIRGSVPVIDHGTEPGETGAGGPGLADSIYGSGSSGNE